ncbi:hypothetical protein N0V84_012613 [Fusarium piperis]|uniref:Uncharacterized protein n=1 Tax=Fusarium piperis TaxID=1435070 RepID=A0A9W8TBN4_9HYPO|nr:hypothetical protein N0V84_012613 [Fusarium piperis]
MSTNDSNDDDFSLTDRPFAWVIIPLAVIVIIGCIATFFQIRRHRRRRQQQWAGQGPRVLGPPGRRRLFVTTGTRGNGRRAPWAGTRSQEGLNELGEAPPPYDGKKERQEPVELRDLEAGGSPPEYPAVPGPAVTRDSRRGE